MAGTLLKSISQDERERAHARSRRMFQTDMEHNRIMAERRGEARGEKRGEKRGEERAKKLEVERRQEERKETAKGFQAKGIPINDIIDVMNLTPEEVVSFGLRRKKTQTPQ